MRKVLVALLTLLACALLTVPTVGMAQSEGDSESEGTDTSGSTPTAEPTEVVDPCASTGCDGGDGSDKGDEASNGTGSASGKDKPGAAGFDGYDKTAAYDKSYDRKTKTSPSAAGSAATAPSTANNPNNGANTGAKTPNTDADDDNPQEASTNKGGQTTNTNTSQTSYDVTAGQGANYQSGSYEVGSPTDSSHTSRQNDENQNTEASNNTDTGSFFGFDQPGDENGTDYSLGESRPDDDPDIARTGAPRKDDSWFGFDEPDGLGDDTPAPRYSAYSDPLDSPIIRYRAGLPATDQSPVNSDLGSGRVFGFDSSTGGSYYTSVAPGSEYRDLTRGTNVFGDSNAETSKLGQATCSFRGDMQVRTQNGLLPISSIREGYRVLARNEITGQMAWQVVEKLHQRNHAATVEVTVQDAAGNLQTIVSNDKHPYFAQVNTVLDFSALSQSSEGHRYRGDIPQGQWLDAQALQPGYRLLGESEQWLTVQSVVYQKQPLTAYNLTVAHDHTYFIQAPNAKQGVWVHNQGACTPISGLVRDYIPSMTPQKPNQAVANALAQDLSAKKMPLNKANADYLYQVNTDPNLSVTVDASKIDLHVTGEWKAVEDGTGGFKATAVPIDNAQWAVTGTVTVKERPNGTYGIYNDTYDYDEKPAPKFTSEPAGFVKATVRNFETTVGEPAGGGGKYNINFSGNTTVDRPREGK